MNGASAAELTKNFVPRYRRYIICAVAVYGALFAFSRVAGQLPPAAVFLLWSSLSVFASAGIAYSLMAKKLRNRLTQREAGFLYQRLKGGLFRLIAAFAISTICVGSLLLASARWSQSDWLIAACGIALCPIVLGLSERFCRANFKTVFDTSNSLALGGAILALLLSVIAFLAAYFDVAQHYNGIIDAFMAQSRPFANSQSAILIEADTFCSLTDGVRAYVLSQSAGNSHAAFAACSLIIAFASYSGLSMLLCSCQLTMSQIREVFLPLECVGRVGPSTARPRITLVALACVLPIIFWGAAWYADECVAEIQSTEEFTMVERVVRNEIGQLAYEYDGRYYDKNVVDTALADIADRSEQLNTRVQNNLVPLINTTFDKQHENIDAYLDWYYGLAGEADRVLSNIIGAAESSMRDQLTSSLAENVDYDLLTEEYRACCDEANDISSEFEDKINGLEIKGIPDWLIVSSKLEPKQVELAKMPAKKLLDVEQRVAISAGAGAIGKALVENAATDIIEKEVTKKMAKKLVQSLEIRGTSASIGSAAGILAPGAGKLIGNAAAAVIGVSIDYALLKADEAENRQAYHDEIAQAIEQARMETLEALPRAGY